MNFCRQILLTATVLILAAATGCTNSDVLSTGNAEFTIVIELANPETRFDQFALVRITAINVRPNDPEADASLGSLDIGILATPEDTLDMDLNNPGELPPSNLVLSSGSYRISKLELTDLIFIDGDPPDLPLNDCTEASFFLTDPGEAGIIELDSADLGGVNINVGANTGQITIQVDGKALSDAFAASWDCIPEAGVSIHPFDEDKFISLAPTYLRIIQR